jgi:hypothetical protein
LLIGRGRDGGKPHSGVWPVRRYRFCLSVEYSSRGAPSLVL